MEELKALGKIGSKESVARCEDPNVNGLPFLMYSLQRDLVNGCAVEGQN